MTAGPAVTVVIVTKDRPKSLLETLARLARLPERPPVVVVDNASSEDVGRVVGRMFADVTVVPLRRNAGAYGRVVGAQRATTSLVAFSDDDSWWAPGALARATELFEQYPRLGLLCARTLVGPDEALDPTCAAMAASPLGMPDNLPGPAVLGFIACATVVRRDAFLDAGGFSERFGIGGEEDLLAIDLARAGWGLAYVEEVAAHHHPSPSRDPVARHRRVVRNDLWTAWLRRPFHGATKRTARVLSSAPGERATWLGLADALREAPTVLRERDPVPRWLEQQIALVQRPPEGLSRRAARTGGTLPE